MIDFHSHILPRMDDGSASVEESVRMLEMEAEQGITHVVATPHFYARHDNPEAFFARRNRAVEALNCELAKHNGLPQVIVGAEVCFFHGMSNSDLLPLLTIGNKSCIMIEMVGSNWQESVYQELQQIYQRWEIVPVIAHIDRYVAPFRANKILTRLAELPVMVQANTDFFLKASTSGMAMRMLRRKQIHLLGSDCHNLASRKPNLGAACQQIRKRLGEDALMQIHSHGSEMLGL